MAVVSNAWEELDIYSATQCLKNFGTGILPSHWLEMVKTRLYDGDTAAAWTIHRIVRDFMAAFSPICPFFSHHISTTLYDASAVDVRSFPQSAIETDPELCSLTPRVIEFNSMVWKSKKDSGLSLKEPIAGIIIPDELVEFTGVLTAMHTLE